MSLPNDVKPQLEAAMERATQLHAEQLAALDAQEKARVAYEEARLKYEAAKLDYRMKLLQGKLAACEAMNLHRVRAAQIRQYNAKGKAS